jgi:hypothetical protein
MITHYLASGFTLLLAFCTLPIPRAFSCDSPVCQQETADLTTLLAPAAATHRAVASGDWSSATTWQGGAVPGAGATVFIPAGVDVRYDLSASPRLDTVRVDGALRFANDRNTRLVLDTLFAPTKTAVIEIGTPAAPIPPQFTAEILITGDRRDANGNTAFAPGDTKQFGRGVISKGKVTMHGAKKDSFLEIAGDALAGDNVITLKRAPVGWRVGDILVLAGTGSTPADPVPNRAPFSLEFDWFARALANEVFDTERLMITAINGTQISFQHQDVLTGDRSRLRFNHRLPVGIAKPAGVTADFAIHIGNLTRNILISSESGRDLSNSGNLLSTTPLASPVDGSVTQDPANPRKTIVVKSNVRYEIDFTQRINEVWKRGHAMFMHNTDVDIAYVAFWHLGRTDKTRDLDEVGVQTDGKTGKGTNQRGRYATHFHRTGTLDWMGVPSHIQGCAIWGSPGWGIGHHEANLTVEDNIIYEVLGTAVMQETGNEIGVWRQNLALKTYGGAPFISPMQESVGIAFYDKFTNRLDNFDYGYEGVGFWLHGAGQIAGEDNISAGTAHAAFASFGNADSGLRNRPARDLETRLLPSSQRDIAKGLADPTLVDVAATPIRQLKRLVAYNSAHMIHIWGHKMRGESPYYNLPGSTNVPAHDYYSLVEDFLGWGIEGTGLKLEYSSTYHFRDGLIAASRVDPNRYRLAIKQNATRMDIENVIFDGYSAGLHIPKGPVDYSYQRPWSVSEYRNVTFKGLKRLPVFSSYMDNQDFPLHFRLINATFDAPASPSAPPVPSFTSTSLGSLAYQLDARASSAPANSNPARTSKGIVAFAWDLNNDGQPDAFGGVVEHYFPGPGTYPVTLRVWDENAVTRTLTQNIVIPTTPAPYPNAFRDGDFTSPALAPQTSPNSTTSPRTWFLHAGASQLSNGALRLDYGYYGGAVQIVPDNRMRRGPQTFSLRARSTGGANDRFHVRLYAINGEFNLPDYNSGSVPGRTDNQPVGAGAMHFERRILVDQDLGGATSTGASGTWKTFSWNVDLGTGSDFIVVQLSAFQSNLGPVVEVDDVSLVGPGTYIALPPAANKPPALTLDLPARVSPRLTMVADARDDDGTIAKVEFFDGANKIGEVTSPPYQWTLFNAAPGVHEYTARVTDDRGAQATAPERYALVMAPDPATPAPAPVSPPAAPTGLAAAVVSGSRVDLTWADASTGETGFEIERRLLPDGAFAFAAFAGPNASAYSDTGLPNGTSFAYRIRAVNTTDPSAYSNTATATTWAAVAAPAFSPAPGVYATTQSITLGSATPGAVIRYTTDGSTPTATTGTVYGGPISLANSATLKAIAYKAQLADSPVVTGDYNIAEPVWEGLLHDNNIATQDGALETSLKANGFTSLAYDNPIVTNPSRPSWWGPAAGYVQVSGTSTTYDWAGFKWNGASRSPIMGTGSGSSGVGRVIITPSVAADTSRKMAVILTSQTGTNTVRVTSIKIGNFTKTFDQPLTASVGKASVGVFTLRARPGQNIEITVAYPNVDWCGVSLAFQDPDSNGSVTPATPTALSAQALSATQVSLSWTDNAANETGYKIERRTGAGAYAQIATTGANVTSYEDIALSAQTTYGYRIRATNAAGDSTYGAEATATTPATAAITGSAYTLFGTAAAQGGTSADNNYELGTRFRTDTAGFVTALRVWRPATNGPTSYTARLWTSTGAKLAQVTISAPTAGAWAEAALDSAIALNAGGTYVVSYSVASGKAYQVNNPATQVTLLSGPLGTLSDGKIGVYTVSASGAFPTSTYQNSNYYADVRFVVPDAPQVPAPQAAYDGWQAGFFTSAQIADTAFSGPTADPDGDGLPNLLEFALGLNPVAAGSTAATTVGTENGTGRLTLTFRRARPATVLTYTVEGSSDLVAWRTLVVNPLGDAGVGDLITVSDAPLPSEDQTRRFLRLRVTAP